MNQRIVSAVILGFVAAFVIGCGTEEKPVIEGLVPVTGTVTLDGQPVAHATVTFVPANPEIAIQGAGARTDANGKYELHTSEGRARGAEPGEYRVVVSRLEKDGVPEPVDGEKKSPMELQIEGYKDAIPEKYSSIFNSQYRVTVPPPEGGELNIDLKSR